MLYAVNPVGFGSMLIAAGRVDRWRSSAALGAAIQPYSPLVAIGLALVLPPVIALATKGKYYLRRTDDGIDLPMYDEHGNPSGEHLHLPRLPSRLRAAGHGRRARPTTRTSARCA